MDFTPKLVEDARIANIADKINYEVYVGGASNSPQVFAANTSSQTSHTYTIQVPSLENALDTVIMIKGNVSFTITGTAAAGQKLVNIDSTNAAGIHNCLAPFPFHQLMTTMSATINQTQVSLNVNDVLPSVLYMVGRDKLNEYNNMTPTQLDNIQSYASAGYLSSPSSVFNTYLQTYDYKNMPRGAFNVVSITGNNAAPDDSAAARTVVITYEFTEPLLLSPLLFAQAGAALQGIQAVNVNLNMDAKGTRAWRAVGTKPGDYDVNVSYNACELQVNFLGLKSSTLAKLSPKNVLPYYKMDRYLTNSNTITAGASIPITSNSIQLSAIPKMAIVSVVKENKNWFDSDYFLPINKVNVNFNTRSGLLSGSTKQQLYKFSVENGLNQSWTEWSGSALVSLDISSNLTRVNTVGGPLVLSFGKDIECSDDYSAPGGIGQYNFQITVDTQNTTASTDNYKLVVIMVNQGLFTTERGSSQVYTNILSKSDVLSVLNDAPISDVAVEGVPDANDDVLAGGRKYRSKGKGLSAGGRSGGRSKLMSRLM
jgi:hypothetical protein